MDRGAPPRETETRLLHPEKACASIAWMSPRNVTFSRLPKSRQKLLLTTVSPVPTSSVRSAWQPENGQESSSIRTAVTPFPMTTFCKLEQLTKQALGSVKSVPLIMALFNPWDSRNAPDSKVLRHDGNSMDVRPWHSMKACTPMFVTLGKRRSPNSKLWHPMNACSLTFLHRDKSIGPRKLLHLSNPPISIGGVAQEMETRFGQYPPNQMRVTLEGKETETMS